MVKYEYHPKRRNVSIKQAKAFFEETGKRYKDALHDVAKKYPRYEANRTLKRRTNHSWVIFTCPRCQWTTTLRAKQGWPSHTCSA